MKISKLIVELQRAQLLHGDIECVIELPESLSTVGVDNLSTVETLHFRANYYFTNDEGTGRVLLLDWRT
jgi:hypothetical protein